MPVDGDVRYNSERERWEQYQAPPGQWKGVTADHGELDHPVDLGVHLDDDAFPDEGQRPDAAQ